MALLDRDGVYGAPRFHMAAKKAGIKAHIGAEIGCTSLSNVILSETEPRFRGEVKSKDHYFQRNLTGVGIPRFTRNDSSFRLSLLVQCRSGYQNLCRLITKMKLRAKKGEGTIHEEELREHGIRGLPNWIVKQLSAA